MSIVKETYNIMSMNMIKTYPAGIKTMYHWLIHRWQVYAREIYQVKKNDMQKPMIVIDLYESDYWFVGDEIMNFMSENAIEYECVFVMDSESGVMMAADCAEMTYWLDDEP